MDPHSHPKAVEAHAALATVQQKLVVPKDQYNAHGGYNFRNAESIMRVVKPFLPEGATITMTDEIVEIAGRFYIRSAASFFYLGFTITKYAMAREAEAQKGMNVAQITCSTSSYARKYSLGALLLVDDGTLDPDVNNEHSEADWKKEQFGKAQAGFAEATTIAEAKAMAAKRKVRAKSEGWLPELLTAFTERALELAGSGDPAATPSARVPGAGSGGDGEPDPACPVCMVMLTDRGTCPDCGYDRALDRGAS